MHRPKITRNRHDGVLVLGCNDAFECKERMKQMKTTLQYLSIGLLLLAIACFGWAVNNSSPTPKMQTKDGCTISEDNHHNTITLCLDGR